MKGVVAGLARVQGPYVSPPGVWRLRLRVPPKAGTANTPRNKCQSASEQNIVAPPTHGQAGGTVATFAYNRIVLRNRNPRQPLAANWGCGLQSVTDLAKLD